MYESATKFFKDLHKSDDYLFAVNEIVQHENVFTWMGDDLYQYTVIRTPIQPMPMGEAIWILYENWHHEDFKQVWYCEDSPSLDKALEEIRKHF